MFTVYLYEGEECIAQIQDIFEINADLKLNGSSQVKITLDAQSPYIQKDLLRMWRSIRITELTEEGEKEMLAGVIRWVEANFTQVEIIAESRRVLLEKRLVDQKYKWNQAPLEEVIRTLFEEQNRKSPLPFNIECETGSTVSLEVGEKAVLSSVINSLIKEGVDVFLIGDTLKIGKHIWEDRTQGANYKEFRYDTQDPEGNTIDKAKLVIDAKEMSNKVWGQRSEESIARYGLLEESKSNEDEATYLKEHKEQVSEFNITVGEDSFYQVELGDKVKVIIKGYNELMQFDGVMKIVGKKYRSGDLPSIEYTVSTQRIPQEGVIGTIKQLSEKVNQKTISTTWPQADLSGYATSSAVSSAIQSQNKKIEQKADSSFVQWVAQTAQTALNTANQAKQTAESKADANHNHDDRYYTESEIDNKLSGKADVNHTHNFPTSLPASDVYDRAKQANKPTYTISEIQGLQEALDNKSSSVASLNPTDRIRMPNHRGLHREANTDWAQILFRSNGNDDTSLDFKLGDDNSEFFRFMHNDTWRAAFNYELATYKQKFFAHAQFGEFPTISLAIWDSDTGFNWNGDGNFTMKANGADLNHFYNGRAPIVRQGMNNGEFQHLTQAQYDALGAGRPNNVIYYITD